MLLIPPQHTGATQVYFIDISNIKNIQNIQLKIFNHNFIWDYLKEEGDSSSLFLSWRGEF